MRVLMCGNHPKNTGGMSSVIQQIRTYNWGEHNVKLKFIPTFYPGNNFVKVFYFSFAFIRVLTQIIFVKPDIVYMHMSYKGSFTRKYSIHLLCKLLGRKDVIHLHGSEFLQWYNKLNNKKQNKVKKLLRECDCFIVLGEKWKNIIEKIEPKAKTVVINNSVCIPEAITKWNETFLLIFLGVLIPRKGLKDLLNAISQLDTKNNFKLIIAGTGEQEKELKEMTELLSINDKVEYVGWLDAIAKIQLLKKSQVLVLPSYNEGLPIAIIEAMSYGLPIISTDVGDISTAVIHGENGFLFRPGDVDTLTSLLDQIINNRVLWEKFSARSKGIAKEKFSEYIFFEKLTDIFADICD